MTTFRPCLRKPLSFACAVPGALALLLAGAPLGAAAESPVLERIGGRPLESVTLRNPASQAVVVFENGSRATLDGWNRVFDAVRPDASVFAYNRPGYANSAPATTPRDGATIVEELRATLKHKGLKPPYVLVGHSLGGLYMQLFARRYPQEVKGLVLVDSLYPRVIKKSEEFPWATRVAKRLFFSKAVNEEIDAIHATGEAILALPGIDDKPVIRLVNQPTSKTAIAVDFGAFNFDPQTRALVRGLYPKAKTIVADSSHQMQSTSPELVASAIREVLAAPGQ